MPTRLQTKEEEHFQSAVNQLCQIRHPAICHNTATPSGHLTILTPLPLFIYNSTALLFDYPFLLRLIVALS